MIYLSEVISMTKSKKSIFLLIGIIIFIFSILDITYSVYLHKNTPEFFYNMSEGVQYCGATGLSILVNNGETYSIISNDKVITDLGNFQSANIYQGVIECRSYADDYIYFINNTPGGGAWEFQEDLFSSGKIESIAAVPPDSSLYPQTDRVGNLGYISRQKVWKISPNYTLTKRMPIYGQESFSEGLAIVWDISGNADILVKEDGTSEKLCIQGGIPSNAGFKNGMLRLGIIDYNFENAYQANIRYTFLTNDNKLLCNKTTFQDAHDFEEGVAAVCQNGKWGFLDLNGNMSIPTMYTAVSDFSNGTAVVCNSDNNIQIIDTKGNQIVQEISDLKFAGQYHDSLILVSLPDSGYGLADLNGKLIVEGVQKSWWDGEFWHITRDDKVDGLLIKSSQIIIWSDAPIRIFRDICIAKVNGKDTIYSLSTGKKIFSSDRIDDFSEGLAYAQGMFRSGYIDKSGNWIIPPVLSTSQLYGPQFTNFRSGYAYAETNHARGLIANPLIYPDGWVEDELIRAKIFGFIPPANTENHHLTREQLIEFISTLIHKRDELQNQGIVDSNLEKSAITNYINTILCPGEIVSKELLAHVLSYCAGALGKVNTNFTSFFDDSDKISPEYYDSVAYIASLGIIDAEDNCFSPQKILTNQESAIIILRFFEIML